MEMPTTTAKELIDSAKFSWVDNTYSGSVPEDVTSNDETTDIAVTEWLNEPAAYANEMFKRWRIGVEVQIFYSPDPGITLIDAEIQLAQLFKQAGWTIEESYQGPRL